MMSICRLLIQLCSTKLRDPRVPRQPLEHNQFNSLNKSICTKRRGPITDLQLRKFRKIHDQTVVHELPNVLDDDQSSESLKFKEIKDYKKCQNPRQSVVIDSIQGLYAIPSHFGEVHPTSPDKDMMSKRHNLLFLL